MFKKGAKFLFLFLGIFLILLGMAFVLRKLFFSGAVVSSSAKNYVREEPRVASQSGFSLMIKKTEKEVEERRKAEEERRRREEETQKFLTQYGPCRSIPILMYHHVADKEHWLYVKKSYFLRQMEHLSKKGYTTISLSDLAEGLKGLKSLPPRPVVLTFDDGYLDFYENVYPVLKTYNFKATVFIITQLVGGGDYLSWEQLREMAHSGLVSLGNHTLSHASLVSLPRERIVDEIVSAEKIIEEKTGVITNVFAYPYGGFNSEAEKILEEKGFVAAVTSSRGLSCALLPYRLPRIRTGNADLSSYGL